MEAGARAHDGVACFDLGRRRMTPSVGQADGALSGPTVSYLPPDLMSQVGLMYQSMRPRHLKGVHA